MFTGIIEEIGVMRRISKQGQAMVLIIEAHKILEDVHLGDSIAVNGVCLTVTTFDHSSITVDVMPETYRQTNLKQLKPGQGVNLERAMSMKGRFGGHVVQGHVDGIGTITSRQPEDNAVVFRIEPHNLELLKYVVPRGSITIDGISLTVIQVTESGFAVSIIPHTLAQTVLNHKKAGDTLNIETDILGKYIERLLSFQTKASSDPMTTTKTTMTQRYLAEHGFL